MSLYYYSHIFPDFRAQHSNYATLLAGRCGNNLWYSVIFPVGPPYSVSGLTGSSVSGVYIFLDFTLLLGLLWTCPSLFLSVVAGIGWKYFAMVLLCPVQRSFCFTSVSLLGVYCVKEFPAAPYVHSTPCPSYADALRSKNGIYFIFKTIKVSFL